MLEACQNLDIKEVQELLSEGADVNFVESTGANCWYSGDTTTPLYEAISSHKYGDDEKKQVEVVALLLKNGANPKFAATRGGWNHSSSHATFT